MGNDIRWDLARLHGEQLRVEAEGRRLARPAEPRVAARQPVRASLGTGLVRAGLRLGGQAPGGTARVAGPARAALRPDRPC